jgi:hypothetical protein
MARIITSIPNPMVLKSSLPHFHIRTEILLCPIRESAFDQLHCPFERRFADGSDQKVKVVRHHYKFVQQIVLLPAVVKKDVDEETGTSV